MTGAGGASFALAHVVGMVKVVVFDSETHAALVRIWIPSRLRGRDRVAKVRWDTCLVEFPREYARMLEARLPRKTWIYADGPLRALERDEGAVRIRCRVLRVLRRPPRLAGASKVKRAERAWRRDDF